jgi:hypothetical protein
VALLDDDRSKNRLRLEGLRVRGTRDDIAAVAERFEADTLVLALPNAEAATLRDLATRAADAGLDVVSLPPLKDIMGGRPTPNDLRDLDVADLFERLREELRRGAGSGGGSGSEFAATRALAERFWPVTAEREAGRGPKGLLKRMLRKLMRWYVEPLAADQRVYNSSLLKLVDALSERADEAAGSNERAQQLLRELEERLTRVERRGSAALPTATRLQHSAQRWPTQSGYARARSSQTYPAGPHRKAGFAMVRAASCHLAHDFKSHSLHRFDVGIPASLPVRSWPSRLEILA